MRHALFEKVWVEGRSVAYQTHMLTFASDLDQRAIILKIGDVEYFIEGESVLAPSVLLLVSETFAGTTQEGKDASSSDNCPGENLQSKIRLDIVQFSKQSSERNMTGIV